jgi:biotin carboxyl carrier protein
MPRQTASSITAEMVANVLTVSVAAGDTVAAGDIVVLLESMKMEIPVLAETAGVVSAVKVAPGDVVQEGDVLVELNG